jgi:hypothetical protein
VESDISGYRAVQAPPEGSATVLQVLTQLPSLIRGESTTGTVELSATGTAAARRAKSARMLKKVEEVLMVGFIVRNGFKKVNNDSHLGTLCDFYIQVNFIMEELLVLILVLLVLVGGIICWYRCLCWCWHVGFKLVSAADSEHLQRISRSLSLNIRYYEV